MERVESWLIFEAFLKETVTNLEMTTEADG